MTFHPGGSPLDGARRVADNQRRRSFWVRLRSRWPHLRVRLPRPRFPQIQIPNIRFPVLITLFVMLLISLGFLTGLVFAIQITGHDILAQEMTTRTPTPTESATPTQVPPSPTPTPTETDTPVPTPTEEPPRKPVVVPNVVRPAPTLPVVGGKAGNAAYVPPSTAIPTITSTGTPTPKPTLTPTAPATATATLTATRTPTYVPTPTPRPVQLGQIIVYNRLNQFCNLILVMPETGAEIIQATLAPGSQINWSVPIYSSWRVRLMNGIPITGFSAPANVVLGPW